MKNFLGVVRGPFLLLVPASLAPAVALVWRETGHLPWGDILLVLVGGLAAHMAVNALNEYEDFRSGLDLNTRRTPFSGGSGTLVAHPSFAPATLAITVFTLALTLGVGLHYLRVLGAQVVLPGLAGLAIIVAYTRWLNRFPVACLLAPGIGFGTLMLNLGYLALAREFSLDAFICSLPVAFLVSNLLLINQFPDIEADRAAGRHHLPIAFGARAAARVSLLLVLAAYGVVVGAVALGLLPSWAMLALLTAPLGVAVALRALRFSGDELPAFIPSMGHNVIVTLLTPVLLAIGIAIG